LVALALVAQASAAAVSAEAVWEGSGSKAPELAAPVSDQTSACTDQMSSHQ
jgi:hypothetical protein